MPAWYEQLRDFNGAREDHQEDREQTMLARIAQSEGKSGRRVNCEMLKTMGRTGFGP